MPTYEYHCDSCDRNFDVVQSFHDDPLEACPTCGSPVRKVFGSVGIVFKGSGFYKNDSRAAATAKSGDGTPAKGAGPDGPASDGAGTAGGESTGTGSGDTPKPASEPSKKEPVSTPSPASPSTDKGKSSGSKESATA
ncbi:MAG: FmdB family zinc ribbon protein [Acidimicrobiales bacterium]